MRRRPGRGAQAAVQIGEVNRPSGCCPRFFRIPAPIMPPRLLCPKAAREHAEGEKGEADAHQSVGGRQIGNLALPQTGNGEEESAAEETVREHVHRDVRHEPCALQRRHQRLVVNFGAKQVDDDEHRGHNAREEGQPAVSPTPIYQPARNDHKERVPQARFAERAQRRTLQTDPQPCHENTIYNNANPRQPQRRATRLFTMQQSGRSACRP